jgi:diadenosine tetraphosphate (Ap4A) HIT family hydrolase
LGHSIVGAAARPPSEPRLPTSLAMTRLPESRFELDPRLAAESHPVLELGLSSLRLVDDARFPWLLLVPRVPGAVEILDLPVADQLRLWDEIRLVLHVLKEEVGAAKLNVAALGNQVPQLHLHLVARFEGDVAWPRPIWGEGKRVPRNPAERARLIKRIERAVRG